MTSWTARVRAAPGAPAVGWIGGRTVTIDRAADAGGMGLGFNGGELLLLSLAACFTNDLYREASKLGVRLESAEVEVACSWGGDPVRATDVRYLARLTGDTPEALRRLLEHTDRVAEVHNTLRHGAPVTLQGSL